MFAKLFGFLDIYSCNLQDVFVHLDKYFEHSFVERSCVEISKNYLEACVANARLESVLNAV